MSIMLRLRVYLYSSSFCQMQQGKVISLPEIRQHHHHPRIVVAPDMSEACQKLDFLIGCELRWELLKDPDPSMVHVRICTTPQLTKLPVPCTFRNTNNLFTLSCSAIPVPPVFPHSTLAPGYDMRSSLDSVEGLPCQPQPKHPQSPSFPTLLMADSRSTTYLDWLW